MIAFLAITFALIYTAAAGKPHPLSDDFIDLINSKGGTWTAGRNFPKGTTLEHIKMRLGLRLDRNKRSLLPVRRQSISDDDLPENFDPREKWSNCPSLNEIRDQGCCGSCWAFGAVSAMTDRVCIYSNGTQHFHLSAQDMVSCDIDDNGCFGGQLETAWNFWVDKGLVTGGGYKSNEGCLPYEFSDDPNENPSKIEHFKPQPICEEKCRKGYDVEYKKDKHYGSNAYSVRSADYKAELYTNGPIEVTFWVFEDFVHYKSGVYYYTEGKFLGGHAVKMLGWGVENETDYWLCANSWNTSWGDKGYFKIRRGKNELAIESGAVAGEPKL